MNGSTIKLAARRKAPLLWALLFLFIVRVAGQLLVAAGFMKGVLPPMEEWHSGVLPYPLLVFFQILIIILYGKICLDFSRGEGFWATPRKRMGKWLPVVGWIYLVAMALRYIIRMSLYPEERWFGGIIPIFLHWVLAAFLLILGYFNRNHSTQRTESGNLL